MALIGARTISLTTMSNTTDPGKSTAGVASTRTGLRLEDVFDILSAKERQLTALVLTRTESIALDELVTRIASECDGGENHRERIHVGLRHRHLPRLREAGVIEYESQDTITRGTHFEQIVPALDLVREEYSVE